jgi:xanthine dehydrogenase accessory factor
MSFHYNDYVSKFKELTDQNKPYVVVTLLSTIGSAPQDPGAKMIVTNDGLYFGTVGGGKVEAKAIAKSIELINGQESVNFQFIEWNLQKDVGMTCGGVVSLSFELSKTSAWEVVIFGAGHISQELIPLMMKLKCELTCIDGRKEWLDKLPVGPHLKKIHSLNLPAEIDQLHDNSFVVLMTMGHSTDSPIMIEKFKKKKNFPFFGIIGSQSKRNALEKDLRENNLAQHSQDFVCPIGLEIGDNSPIEIAFSIAAQLIEKKDAFFKTAKRQK